MNTAKIVFITISILFFCSCHNRSVRENNQSQIVKEKVEEFDTFIIKFYSDSIFQVNRIIFPLENDLKIKKEYEDALRDSNHVEIEKNEYTFSNKTNWRFLNNNAFIKDSIGIIGGIKYKRRLYKTDGYVQDIIMYADDESVIIILKFKLIKGKWYLYDYIDGFING